MKESRKKTGLTGEKIAAQHLESKGYDIIARNFRYKRGEIDIIARHNDCYVFVEVKTRKNKDFGPPESFVSQKQQDLITAAASAFTLEINWEGMIRFDIIAIIPGEEIVHFEDAFY